MKTSRGRLILKKSVRILVIIVGVYVLACLAAYIFQAKLLYFPARGYPYTPRDANLSFESLRLRAADGVAISAWYVPRDDARGTVIFCHGNAGNISDRLFTIKEFHRLRLNVLIFDYRGYGESEGSPSEAGTYADAEAAWNHLVDDRGVSPERIVIAGRSLGGAVAIELAARHEPAALIVESTFTSIVDVGRIHYRFLPVGIIARHRYESIKKVREITCPKYFSHGRDDGLIPLELGRKLYEAAAAQKRFLETPGGHGDSGFFYTPDHTKMLDEFLGEVLEAGPDPD